MSEAAHVTAVLAARSIVHTYVNGEIETPVLRGIDLTIGAGEAVALMGPSGSGKSTLLSILGTLLRPTAGDIELVGEPTRAMDDAELTEFRNRHLGFVFQFHHLLPDFTALENVLCPAYAAFGEPRPQDWDRAAALLARVALDHRLDYRVTRLSGGQKQRVAVARALMMKPEIVLADEPTGNLDREASGQVIALVHQLAREEGTAFLISTHDPDIAASCRRIVHLVDGRVEPRPV